MTAGPDRPEPDPPARPALHSDFAGLACSPGRAHLTDREADFALVNVAAFGGAADRPTHVPQELARLGSLRVWESTGSSDALPFWNTNFDADAWLYIVFGQVRVEFKQPETDRRYGHLTAGTGDLFKLPRGIAHRTFSGDGRRRISIELLEHDPQHDAPASAPVPPDPSGVVGGFTFTVHDDVVEVRWPGGSLAEPRHYFGRAVRALLAHDLHLYHNEFLGGLIVDDRGAEVVLKAGGYAEALPPARVAAVLAGLAARLDEPPPGTPG